MKKRHQPSGGDGAGYEARYRELHSRGLQWFSDAPTPIVEDVLRRYPILPGDVAPDTAPGGDAAFFVLRDAVSDATACDHAVCGFGNCGEMSLSDADFLSSAQQMPVAENFAIRSHFWKLPFTRADRWKADILEIGCGEGRDAGYLLQMGYRVWATDAAPAAIAYCRRKYSDFAARFAVFGCLQAPLCRQFRFIYAIAVLHMLVNDRDRMRFYRCLREGLTVHGVALICSMGDGEQELRTGGKPQEQMICARAEGGKGETVQTARLPCRMVSFQTLRQELSSAELELLEDGLTSAPSDFPCMMYAVVHRADGA